MLSIYSSHALVTVTASRRNELHIKSCDTVRFYGHPNYTLEFRIAVVNYYLSGQGGIKKDRCTFWSPQIQRQPLGCLLAVALY